MIKKEHRLSKNRHFQYIYRKGQAKHTQFISVVFVKTKIKPCKIGFSVSKKIGKAHIRNKVKRRMRESCGQILNQMNPNYNYIFVAKNGIDALSFQGIKKEIIYVLKKAELLNV